MPSPADRGRRSVQSAVPFDPLVTPPTAPLGLEGIDAYVLRVTFGEMAGHGRARTAAREGLTKPADIAGAERSEPERVFVPLWRIEGSSESFHVGLTSRSHGGGRRIVLPTGGFDHQDRAVLVLARRHFAIDPSEKAKLELRDAKPLADAPIADHERVDPDVTRADAEAEATSRFRRMVAPQRALYASIDVRIRSAALVWLPVYVVRYRYAGEANDGVATEYHVAISARDGALVSERRPPLLGSIASKLRSFF
jgi:hypothetical protein